MEQLLKRQEVQKEYTWDLESVYQSDEAWEQDYKAVEALIPKHASFQGKMSESAGILLSAIRVRDDIYRILWQVSSYASMRRDQDTSNPAYQAMTDRVSSLYAKVRAAGAYLTPELIAIPEDTLERFLQEESDLQAYRHELEDTLREKAHVRSQEVEELLAQASEVTGAPGRIFGLFANADLKFPTVTDEHGSQVELTEGRWGRLRESPDRSVREAAFRALYDTYTKFRNTLAATYSASVKKDVFYARVRKYPSARAMALSGNNIPESVYDSLVETVSQNLSTLHRYMHLRRRILGYDELHMWDLYNPIVPNVARKIPYDEAVETILAALAPLGDEYIRAAREGLTTARWVDRYENLGKRSGAYSGGAYTTHPFILMNYDDTLNSMFTLAHELGHSMHSHLLRQHQPFHYGSVTIFIAEVASTFNEALLTDHLLRTSSDEQLRMFVINHALEGYRATLYRQTMFAEFEHVAHQWAEEGKPLTADGLSQMYYQLNQKYYGTEGVVVDKEIEMEWGRIPHFYTPFYVYQYSTGISAAAALAQQVLSGGPAAVQRYLDFLKSGVSDYSINLLQKAGVDMTSPEPVQQALGLFARHLDDMENLIGAGHTAR